MADTLGEFKIHLNNESSPCSELLGTLARLIIPFGELINSLHLIYVSCRIFLFFSVPANYRSVYS